MLARKLSHCAFKNWLNCTCETTSTPRSSSKNNSKGSKCEVHLKFPALKLRSPKWPWLRSLYNHGCRNSQEQNNKIMTTQLIHICCKAMLHREKTRREMPCCTHFGIPHPLTWQQLPSEFGSNKKLFARFTINSKHMATQVPSGLPPNRTKFALRLTKFISNRYIYAIYGQPRLAFSRSVI